MFLAIGGNKYSTEKIQGKILSSMISPGTHMRLNDMWKISLKHFYDEWKLIFPLAPHKESIIFLVILVSSINSNIANTFINKILHRVMRLQEK